MSNNLVLVTGGARSGKSTFAEKYVLHYSPKCDYIATAEILDDEMSGNFVKVIKEYCQKDFGRDDMFNIVII